MSLFTTVISKVPKRNAFDLSFENLLTQEFGELIPVSIKEILPHDNYIQSTEAVVKMAPLLAPIYSRIDLYLHYFFVPLRLLQTDWEDFITTGVDGTQVLLTPPTSKLVDIYSTMEDGTSYANAGVSDGDLRDYLGFPSYTVSNINNITGLGTQQINVLSALAYQKIYSDWYRDELLDTFEFQPVAGGELSASDRRMAFHKRYRSWKKDYFTSARPDAQLGAPVMIPGAGTVAPNGNFQLGSNASGFINGKHLFGAGASYSQDRGVGEDPRYVADVLSLDTSGSFNAEYADIKYAGGLVLDGVNINVNDLRRALKLQQWQEKNMRGGNRYIENIYHHFGVKSSDARLQRSELLGGRKIPVMISDVMQNAAAPSATSTPLSTLAGKGTAAAKTQTIKWHAEEHGFIICMASIMPHAAYLQGLERMYWRTSYLDYAWPLFGNLGEQEVKNAELYLLQNNFNDTFGYQSRYAEYKHSNNQIHGEFRSTQAYWHNARIFGLPPALNNDFVQLNDPSRDDSTTKPQNRIFAYQPSNYGHFFCHFYHNIKVVRALPKYGIPSI